MIDRRQLLGLALGWLGAAACSPSGSDQRSSDMTTTTNQRSASRLPVLFIGHGSPMNAIDDNAWSRGFTALGKTLPTPTAILSVSAHWYTGGTLVTANEQPETIHDFGGFPRALFEIQYPARGDGALATRISRLLADRRVEPSLQWGLDHGTWTVLRHIRPAADVPVVQLSIDRRLSPAEHLALGRELAPLRDEGVLIMGSGNVTHNLDHAFASMRSGDTTRPAWAATFDEQVVAALDQRDFDRLTTLLGSDAGRASHPSIDHYLPLLYAAGAASRDDAPSYPVEGWDLGSLSMRSVRFG